MESVGQFWILQNFLESDSSVVGVPWFWLMSEQSSESLVWSQAYSELT